MEWLTSTTSSSMNMEELGRTPDEKALLKLVSSPVALGRPFLTAPGVPSERVALLREAFDSTMADPGFLEDAKRAQLDLDPMTGAAVAEIVQEVQNTRSDLIEKVRSIMLP